MMMMLSRRPSLAILILTFTSTLSLLLQTAHTQATPPFGYQGYSLSTSGDPNSVVYDTASTPFNGSTTFPEPDVYLNASVSVETISILVSNLTAKVNLDAQVLKLLYFNAGVDVSINRVSLLIEKVKARALLEARLENLVLMVGNVLDSIDLNPILATLGNGLNNIVNETVGGLIGGLQSSGGGANNNLHIRSAVPPSYELQKGILYSVNDYHGNVHTNRRLAQNGSIYDEYIHNNGQVYDEKIVGYYLNDMQFDGRNESVVVDGKTEYVQEYVYHPMPGVIANCEIYTRDGQVVKTTIISEVTGGGSSTVGDGT